VTDTGKISEAIGRKIMMLRRRKGLTLSELARSAGVSKSTLSEIESGNVNPTINTLWAIARALGVSFGELVEPLQEICTEDVCVQLLKRELNVELYLMHIRRKVTYVSSPHPEGARERIIVLRGRLLCGPLDEPRLVEVGSSTMFSADRTHIYATFDEDCTCLVLITYSHTFARPNTVITLETLDHEAITSKLEETAAQVQLGLPSYHIVIIGPEEQVKRAANDYMRNRYRPMVKIVSIERDSHTCSIFLFHRDPFKDLSWVKSDLAEVSECMRKCVSLLKDVAYSTVNRDSLVKLAERNDSALGLLASEYLAFLGEPVVPAYVKKMYEYLINIVDNNLTIKSSSSFETYIDARLYTLFEPLHPGYVRQMIPVAYHIARLLRSSKMLNVLDIGCGPCHHVKLMLELLPHEHVRKLNIVCIDKASSLVNYAKMIMKEYDNVNIICDDFLRYECSYKFDIILCVGASHHIDTWKFLARCSKLISEDGVLIIADEFIPAFNDWRSRMRAAILHHLAYVVDSLVELSTEDLSEVEKKLVTLVKTCCIDTLHEILSNNFEKGLSHFLKHYRELEEIIPKISLRKLTNLAVSFYLFSYLELTALRLGLAYVEERKTTLHNFIRLAEKAGFKLVETCRVYPTYGHGGTHVIVLRRE